MSEKNKAEKFLNDGSKWSNGELIEIPSKKYLKETLNADENVYLSVDIAFYKNNGKRIEGRIQEIDGLLLSETDEIESIISMKINKKRHSFDTDNDKLLLMKNLPDNGIEMKNYILNNDQLKKLSNTIKNEAVEAKIIYTDLRTGREITEPPSIFKYKIKSSYDAINSFEKIHPETFNTTKEILIESSYQSIKNKF